jgi:hypothetical protein
MKLEPFNDEAQLRPPNYNIRKYSIVHDARILGALLDTHSSGIVFLAHKLELTKELIAKAEAKSIKIYRVKGFPGIAVNLDEIDDKIINEPLA